MKIVNPFNFMKKESILRAYSTNKSNKFIVNKFYSAMTIFELYNSN